MYSIKKILFFLFVVQNLLAQKDYKLSFTNAYGVNFDVVFKKEKKDLVIEFYDNQSLQIETFNSNDSIDSNIMKLLYEKSRKTHKIQTKLANYPDIFNHIENIYNKSKSELLDELKISGNTYCGMDIFLKIEDKTDIYSEHKLEVKDDYHYIINLIKTEFNDYIVEYSLNPILKYFDIHYRVINIKPLLVEIYDRTYFGDDEVKYDFPKSKEIYFILKDIIELSEYNIQYLKKNYESIFFIVDDKFYMLNALEREGLYDSVNHGFQRYENVFSESLYEIKFTFKGKKDIGIFEPSEGLYHSKKIRFIIDYNDAFEMYVFTNFITGFNAGVRFFNDNDYDFVVWNNNVDYPGFHMKSMDIYDKDTVKNDFQLEITKYKNELKGVFSGVLYNKFTNDKITIEEGTFLIDLSIKEF